MINWFKKLFKRKEEPLWKEGKGKVTAVYVTPLPEEKPPVMPGVVTSSMQMAPNYGITIVKVGDNIWHIDNSGMWTLPYPVRRPYRRTRLFFGGGR